MGDELGGAEADLLVVAPVAAPELQDETRQDQLADVGELGVDDGHQGGVDVGEGRRRRLRLDNGTRQQAAAAHHVLAEQRLHDQSDVGDVHLCCSNNSSTGFAQSCSSSTFGGFVDRACHFGELIELVGAKWIPC